MKPPPQSDHRRTDVVIIPVHDRRITTLACLRGLSADGVLSWAIVLVVDDGSSDGTGEAVRAEFPEVAQLRGDGTWWWCSAIRRGMEWALERGAKRIFWLNDDCRPPPGGMLALRECVQRETGVAWLEAQAPGGWSYGGHHKTAWRIRRCTPAEEARDEIDTFSGNCVCLPRAWIERVGLPHDHFFPHGIGDLDYGLRLRAAGASLRAVPGVVAVNNDPSRPAWESWLTSARPMRAIWRDFSSPRSYFYFPAWRRFALRHWGPLWGWVVFAAPYARWTTIALGRAVAPGMVRAWAQRRALNSHSARETDSG